MARATATHSLQEEAKAALFWGHVAHHFFTLVHRSYLRRSRGGTDEQGESWAPLKESTVKKKLRLARRHRFTPSGARRRPFPSRAPSTPHKRYWAVRARYMARLAPVMGFQAAALEATRFAWGAATNEAAKIKVRPTRGLRVPIMIDSGRLIRSYSPGAVTNRYHPRRDQLYRRSPNSITIGSLVPYAEHAEKKRPVLTSACAIWVRQALRVASRRARVGRMT